MKSVRDEINERTLDDLRIICRTIRIQFASDDQAAAWYCANCRNERSTNSCFVCNRNDFLIPNNAAARTLLPADTQVDATAQAVHDQVEEKLSNDKDDA